MRAWKSGFVMAVGLVVTPGTAPAQPHVDERAMTEMSHVRSRHAGLRELIARGVEESPAFRRMADAINASDGIVFVESGVCKYGVRACLVKVTSAGRHRFLFVKVDTGKRDRELIASIGHELRHAIEVLSDPGVTNYAGMYFFYKSNPDHGGFSSPAFETKAAIEAGEAVADEIGRSQRSNASE